MPSSEGPAPGARLLARLTGAPFGALLLAALGVLAWARPGGSPWNAIVPALLVILCLAMAAAVWKRRPYDRARLGFLLVHLGPALILLGSLGSPWVAALGLAALALGLPWMFYLKPLLRKKEGIKPPAWQRLTLQGTRILFLATGALLVRPILARAWPPRWALAAWVILALALHLHHTKGWKGRRAQLAGLAAWGLGLGAYLVLR